MNVIIKKKKNGKFHVQKLFHRKTSLYFLYQNTYISSKIIMIYLSNTLLFK